MIRPHGAERCTSSVVSGYALHVVAGAQVGTIENWRELALFATRLKFNASSGVKRP
jgi:hypothetical protein